MVDGRTPVSGDHHTEKIPPSENDYVIGVVIRYGDFTYGTFSDLDGEYTKSEFGYFYNDIEKSVIPRVGELDVYNVDHHGSEHSSSQAFLDKIKPRVSIVSCGFNNSFQHPDQRTLDRLLPISDVFITEDCNPKAKYGHAVIAYGDITTTVSSTGKTYHVLAGNVERKYESKATKQPPCKL
jgi:hypothetical protein